MPSYRHSVIDIGDYTYIVLENGTVAWVQNARGRTVFNPVPIATSELPWQWAFNNLTGGRDHPEIVRGLGKFNIGNSHANTYGCIEIPSYAVMEGPALFEVNDGVAVAAISNDQTTYLMGSTIRYISIDGRRTAGVPPTGRGIWINVGADHPITDRFFRYKSLVLEWVSFDGVADDSLELDATSYRFRVGVDHINVKNAGAHGIHTINLADSDFDHLYAHGSVAGGKSALFADNPVTTVFSNSYFGGGQVLVDIVRGSRTTWMGNTYQDGAREGIVVRGAAISDEGGYGHQFIGGRVSSNGTALVAGQRSGIHLEQYAKNIIIDGIWFGNIDATLSQTYPITIDATVEDTIIGKACRFDNHATSNTPLDNGIRTRIKGLGREAAATGVAPVAANWSCGDIVQNTNFRTEIWKKDYAGIMRRLA